MNAPREYEATPEKVKRKLVFRPLHGAPAFNNSRISQVSSFKFPTMPGAGGGGNRVQRALVHHPAVSVEGNGMKVDEIRDCGVYLLPDGRELIASNSGGFFKLYDPLAWKYLGPPLYEIRDEMSLTCFGRPTAWRVSDMIDKRQTAPHRPLVFGKSA